MSNKPVAWVNKDESGLSFKNHGGGWQPLYTHPANLTSLEIADAMELVFGEQIEEQFGNDLEEFARAILRKAQENVK